MRRHRRKQSRLREVSEARMSRLTPKEQTLPPVCRVREHETSPTTVDGGGCAHTSGAETQGGGTVERTVLSKLRCVTCSTSRRILAALAQWPWRHIALWPRQLRGRSTREPIAITKRAAGAVIQTISRCTLSNSIGGAWSGPQLGRSGACSAQLANKVFSSSMCACRRHFFFSPHCTAAATHGGERVGVWWGAVCTRSQCNERLGNDDRPSLLATFAPAHLIHPRA